MRAQNFASFDADLGWDPYCGVGPAPAEIAGRWNFDPIVMGLLALSALAYAVHRRRGGEGGDLLVAAGLAVLAIAFVSPLCALSSALFSARVVHHALLIAVAAPLLAFGLPGRGLAPPLSMAVVAHALALWIWHAPEPYAWALSHDAAYWLMQASLFGSAFAFWRAVRRAGGIAAAGALLLTMMQTGLLGALITFAAAPLYAPHLLTTQAWGLEPLADQQLAGLIMWAPMAGAYLAVALALVGRSLAPDGHRAATA